MGSVHDFVLQGHIFFNAAPLAAPATTEYGRLLHFSSPKIIKLIKILEQSVRELRPSTENSDVQERHHITALIFVQMKQTATVLTHILHRVAENNPDLSFLRVDFAVGGQGGYSVMII